jgi:hypothetical protein
LEVRQNPENAVAASSQPRRWSRGVAEFFELENRAALLIYLALSFFFYGLPIVRHFTTSYIGAGADPTIFLWAIAWWPHAILNRLNPFLTAAIWAPTGCNLAWITSIPGPSLHAFSMFLLCRYVAKRFWPALLGGLIFAFSEYTISQSTSHMFLLFIFPAPLAILLVLRRMNQELSRTTFVTLLSIVLTFEFLSSTELFATISIFGTFAIVLAYVIWNSPIRRALEGIIFDLAVTYAILAVILSPYLYYVFAQGVPPPINPGSAFSNDLLALVMPTQVFLIGGHTFDSSTALMGSWGEMSGYLGPGMIVVVVLFVISKWRDPVGKLLTLSLALAMLLSLGPVLHVLGSEIVPMPWWLFSKLPLTNQALPGRFGMYIYLAAALIVSIFFSENRYPAWLDVSLAILSVGFLAPNLSRLVVTSSTDEPMFFKSGECTRYIAAGDNVLFLPHGEQSMSLLWQAQSDFYYRIATGRVGMTPPTSARWPILQSFDSNQAILGFTDQLKAFLGANQVKEIIVEESKHGPWPQLLAKLPITPIAVDGVLFYRVPDEIRIAYANATPGEIANRQSLDAFAMLVSGANRYLAQRFPLAQLTPWSAQQLHMIDLPGVVPVKEAENNWWQNLWLGPVGESTVGIGILGRYENLESVSQRYGPYANLVFFPYPKRLDHPRPEESGQLLMIFDQGGLRDASMIAKQSLTADGPTGRKQQ